MTMWVFVLLLAGQGAGSTYAYSPPASGLDGTVAAEWDMSDLTTRGFVADKDWTPPLDTVVHLGGRGSPTQLSFWSHALGSVPPGVQAGAFGGCRIGCAENGLIGMPDPNELGFRCGNSLFVGSCEAEAAAKSPQPLWVATDAPPSSGYWDRAQSGSELLTLPVGVVAFGLYANVNACRGDYYGIVATRDMVRRILDHNGPNSIRTWNHPELVALNQCLATVATEITPVIACRVDDAADIMLRNWLGLDRDAPLWAHLNGETCGYDETARANLIAATYGAVGAVRPFKADPDWPSFALQGHDGSFAAPSPAVIARTVDRYCATYAASWNGSVASCPPATSDWSQHHAAAWEWGLHEYPLIDLTFVMTYANPYEVVTPEGHWMRDTWSKPEFEQLVELLRSHALIAMDLSQATGLSPLSAQLQATVPDGLNLTEYGPKVYLNGFAMNEQGVPYPGQRVRIHQGVFYPLNQTWTEIRSWEMPESNREYVRLRGTLLGTAPTFTVSGALARISETLAPSVGPVPPSGSAVDVRGQVINDHILVRELYLQPGVQTTNNPAHEHSGSLGVISLDRGEANLVAGHWENAKTLVFPNVTSDLHLLDENGTLVAATTLVPWSSTGARALWWVGDDLVGNNWTLRSSLTGESWQMQTSSGDMEPYSSCSASAWSPTWSTATEVLSVRKPGERVSSKDWLANYSTSQDAYWTLCGERSAQVDGAWKLAFAVRGKNDFGHHLANLELAVAYDSAGCVESAGSTLVCYSVRKPEVGIIKSSDWWTYGQKVYDISKDRDSPQMPSEILLAVELAAAVFHKTLAAPFLDAVAAVINYCENWWDANRCENPYKHYSTNDRDYVYWERDESGQHAAAASFMMEWGCIECLTRDTVRVSAEGVRRTTEWAGPKWGWRQTGMWTHWITRDIPIVFYPG